MARSFGPPQIFGDVGPAALVVLQRRQEDVRVVPRLRRNVVPGQAARERPEGGDDHLRPRPDRRGKIGPGDARALPVPGRPLSLQRGHGHPDVVLPLLAQAPAVVQPAALHAGQHQPAVAPQLFRQTAPRQRRAAAAAAEEQHRRGSELGIPASQRGDLLVFAAKNLFRRCCGASFCWAVPPRQSRTP